MAKNGRLRSGFNLGGEAAEADGLLDEAFIESDDFRIIASKTEHKCFLVGRTGAGKSAVLQRIEEINPDHVIRINPENLSLPYITNLQAIRYLDSLEINLDTFWQTLWRHVLLVEILKHRYNVDGQIAKTNVLQNLRAKFKNDRAKQAALAYLEEFEGRFWCEADERVRDITNRFTERIEAAGGAGFDVAGVGKATAEVSGGSETSQETKLQQVARFQRVVNETQLARLNKMIDVLDDDILESPHDFRYVIIDDLDKEWVDERIANDLIRCLFSTVYSLQHVRHLKVLVALRTNIFQELDFGKRGGGQEEKLRALVLEVQWTRAALIDLLDERTRVAARKFGLDINSFSEFLPNSNSTMGRPIDYILDRTLLRPRDALAFANECFKVGIGKDRLAWADIKTAERAYSSGRLLALRDEWKGTYPGIHEVIEKFRRGRVRMTRDEFQERLDDAILLLSDGKFEGVSWLTNASQSLFTSGADASWAELYQPMVRILFSIGLIGISPQRSDAPVFFGDDAMFVEQQSNLDRARYFYVQRTYQLSLDMEPGEGGVTRG